MSGDTRVPVEQARDMVLQCTAGPQCKQIIPLLEAAGRVAAQDIHAIMDQPPFHRSPLDGYAVRSADIAGAAPGSPAVLRIAETVYAGDISARALAPGEATQVTTGTALPPEADCVVRQEDTQSLGEKVEVYVSHTRHQNFCFRGEDMQRGQLLCRQGDVLDSARIGVLAGQGMDKVTVFSKPRVGILSTGSELTKAGSPLPGGHIYDSNGCYLAARVGSQGAVAVLADPTPDDPERIAAALWTLWDQCDLIVTTGGVSVGTRDHLPAVARRMQAQILFHGIYAKPGGPAMAMTIKGKPVICLSGNPFAAAATAELLAASAIKKLAGRNAVLPEVIEGILRDDFPKPSPGRRFVRACMRGGDVFLSPKNHESGKLFSLVGCNCLLDIPAGSPALCRGERVKAILFD